MNELEVRLAIIDALRERRWHSATAERIARAIEDGDVVIKVAAEAWL